MTRTLVPSFQTDKRLRRSRRLRRTSTVIASAFAAVVIWIIAVPVGRLDLVVRSGSSTQTVGLVSVAIVALVAGAAAWATLAILERIVRNARLIWTIVGSLVLLLTLLGPLSLAVGPGTVWVLLATHIVVGATLILGLTRFAVPRGE